MLSTSHNEQRQEVTRREFLTRSAAFGVGLPVFVGWRQLQAGEAAGEDDPQERCLWEGPYSMPAVAIHAAVLPTDDVLFYQSGSTVRILN